MLFNQKSVEKICKKCWKFKWKNVNILVVQKNRAKGLLQRCRTRVVVNCKKNTIFPENPVYQKSCVIRHLDRKNMAFTEGYNFLEQTAHLQLFNKNLDSILHLRPLLISFFPIYIWIFFHKRSHICRLQELMKFVILK